MVQSKSLKSDLQIAIEASKLGGEIIEKNFYGGFTTDSKDYGEPVTSVDIEANNIIREFIHQKTPKDNLHSEESYNPFYSDKRNWIIDPLDGTCNFILGIPYCATSLALWDKYTQIAVVYNPFTKSIYSACNESGAFRNKKNLHVSNVSELSKATVAFIIGYKEKENSRASNIFIQLRSSCFRLLDTWAPSLDWSMLAQGKIDALIFLKGTLYDRLAGMLLVQESGGKITTLSGNSEINLNSEFLLATNGQENLHNELLKLTNKYFMQNSSEEIA